MISPNTNERRTPLQSASRSRFLYIFSARVCLCAPRRLAPKPLCINTNNHNHTISHCMFSLREPRCMRTQNGSSVYREVFQSPFTTALCASACPARFVYAPEALGAGNHRGALFDQLLLHLGAINGETTAVAFLSAQKQTNETFSVIHDCPIHCPAHTKTQAVHFAHHDRDCRQCQLLQSFVHPGWLRHVHVSIVAAAGQHPVVVGRRRLLAIRTDDNVVAVQQHAHAKLQRHLSPVAIALDDGRRQQQRSRRRQPSSAGQQPQLEQCVIRWRSNSVEQQQW